MGWYAKKPNKDEDTWEIRDDVKGELVATANDEKLAEAIAYLMEKPRLIVNITGGCLQGLMLDYRLANLIDSYLVDYDVEGADMNDDRVFYVLDADGRKQMVSAGEYRFDHYLEASDNALAVEALLDPKKRVKPTIYRREVSGSVLFKDGSWEHHTVIMDSEHNWGDDKSWLVDAKEKITEQATATNKVKGRRIDSVVDLKAGKMLGEVEDDES